MRDAGEQGLPGWTVFVDANQNGIADPGEQTTTTGTAGQYVFSGLTPGTYTIRLVPQSGFAQTAPGTAAWQELGPDGTNNISSVGYPHWTGRGKGRRNRDQPDRSEHDLYCDSRRRSMEDD